MSQTPDNILRIPIQINGDGTEKPTLLLDRELYVLDNGTLYVGKRQPDNSIVITEIAGRVIDDATITNPTIKGKLQFGNGLVITREELATKTLDKGQVVFVDEGQY